MSKESESSSGEKQSTVENYSVDMPGASRNGSLHLVQRVTSTESTDSTGQQMAVRHVQEPNPGDPDAGLRVTSLTTRNRSLQPIGSGGHANNSGPQRWRRV